MSDQPPWRPFVVRTSGSIAEGIYGLVLATSVMTVSREYAATDAGLIALSVFVTGIVFWLAHVYAHVLATSIDNRRSPSGSELRALMRQFLPLIEVTIPLILILMLGALDLIPDHAAILLATFAALLELAGSGAYAAHLRGAGALGTILSTLAALALGAAAVLLKAIAH